MVLPLAFLFPAFERVPHLAKTLPEVGDNVAEQADFCWRQGGFRATGSGMPGPEVDTNPQQSNCENPG